MKYFFEINEMKYFSRSCGRGFIYFFYINNYFILNYFLFLILEFSQVIFFIQNQFGYLANLTHENIFLTKQHIK